MGIIRESFVCLKNWVDAIELLPKSKQLEAYKAMAKYGLTGEMPKGLSPFVHSLIVSFSDRMERNIARYNASVRNGKLGGRPKKDSENMDEKTQIKNLEKPSKTQPNLNITHKNLEKPTNNLNVNVNVNDNVNVIGLLIKKIKNNKYNKQMRARVREDFNFFIENCPGIKEWFEFHSEAEQVFYPFGVEVVDAALRAIDKAESDRFVFSYKEWSPQELFEICQKIRVDTFGDIVAQIKFNQNIENRLTYIWGCLFK